MQHWTTVIISPSASIHEAIAVINRSGLQIALVVDEQKHFLGIVTDGDVRRGILRSLPLEKPVSEIMNDHPTVAKLEDKREQVLALMKKHSFHHIPIIDKEGCLVDLKVLDDLLQYAQQENWVVIMAGGLGTRLRPLTDERPKPLLKVGKKPILETILENFISYGFRKFFLAVNYKADMIEAYFGNGSQWDIEIDYLHENDRLGTAGALSLLPQTPESPVIVMNGDVLTKVNFQHLLDFHRDHNAQGTMCIREFDFQVPFGVVQTEKHRIIGLDEKPLKRFFVNAGIYVLEPEMINMIPKTTYLDMPDLFNQFVQKKLEAIVFPIHEYWLDIGQIDDFKRANGDFEELFT